MQHAIVTRQFGSVTRQRPSRERGTIHELKPRVYNTRPTYQPNPGAHCPFPFPFHTSPVISKSEGDNSALQISVVFGTGNARGSLDFIEFLSGRRASISDEEQNTKGSGSTTIWTSSLSGGYFYASNHFHRRFPRLRLSAA